MTRTVAVKLDAITGPYIAAMGKAAAATEGFASKADRYVGKHQKTITGLSSSAGKMGIGLGLAFGAAVAATANFDEAMSGVAATGADARANLESLRKTAIQAGQDTKFSATEAANGIEELGKAGIASKDIMGGGLKGALALAAAGNVSVADAANTAASAMNQFGLEGKDVPHVADLIAQAAGTASGEVSDMQLALKQVGVVAAGAGISIDDTATSLALFAKNGLIGSDAGTSMKTMLQRLQGPSEKAKAAMDELGISAYDAEGNFVGLDDVAQQLHDQLGPLTQAQRDQALVTIFGSDAIRGANILYKDGAKALQDQRVEMGKYGTAAEVAATKMDNLKGDVEQLMGSVETAAIGLGEGGQGGLRALTKDITGAVNAFNQAPDSVKSTSLAVLGLSSVALLGAAGVGKLVVGLHNTRSAFRELVPAGSAARRGMVDFGKATGYATAALVGLKVLGYLSNQIDGKFNPALEESTGLLVDVARNAPNAGTALNDAFNFKSGDYIPNFIAVKFGVNGIVDALSRLKENRATDQLAEQFDGLANTTTGVTTRIKLQFASLDQSLAKMGADAPASFRLIADAASAAGLPVKQLTDLFPEYKRQVTAAAEANGIQITSTEQMAGLMRDGVPPAAKTASGALKGTKGVVQDVAGAADDAQKELDDMIESMFAAAHAAIELQGTEDGLEQAIDDATKAVKDNGRTFDKNTEKGRNNRAALRNLAEASIAYRGKLIEQGKKQDVVTAATERGRKKFIEIATKMLGSREEAVKLAKKFGLLGDSIDKVPKKPKIDLTAKFHASATKAVVKMLKYVPGSEASGLANVLAGRAEGGTIEGTAPHPKADNVIIRATPGEFMQPVHAVQHYGTGVMKAIQHERVPKELLQGFASGGEISGASARQFGGVSRQTNRKYATAGTNRMQDQVRDAMNAAFAANAQASGGLPGGGKATGHGMGAVFRYAGGLGMGHSTYPGHGEKGMNKAWDFTPISGGRGNKLAGHAWANAKQYGIWYIIWNRRIASRTRPGAGWRAYTRYGNTRNPNQAHTNHVHISWYGRGTKNARRGLAVVGEDGPELMDMKGGEQLTPARTPEYRFANWGSSGGGGMGGTQVIHHHAVNVSVVMPNGGNSEAQAAALGRRIAADLSAKGAG